MSRRAFSFFPAVLVLGLAGLFLAQSQAWAHVTVSPDTAEPGGYSRLTVNVPNERPDASTVKIEVVLPADHPIASVSLQPVPGWTATAQKQKLPQPVQTDDGLVTEAVTSVVWQGGQIQPGQFQQFPISLGPLPTGVGSLVFKALQTYSDGSVVRWIDPPEAGPEAEHPAPALTLVAAAPPAEKLAASPDVLARILGAAGLVAALGALAWHLLRRAKPAVVAKPVVSKPKVGV